MGDGGIRKNGADGWLTTGEMARLSQTTLRTVRFYEAEGLITSRERDGGSHRKFPPNELRKLQIIADLREVGLSLQEIKDLMALKSGCPTAEQAACKMSAALDAQIQELERRSDTLQRVRRELLSLVGVLRVCQECEHPEFPTRCRDCDLVGEPEAARATQLLWKN
jgi:MerR family transcriptional regulator, Zn(II)-responsive regulator of zntA